MNTASDGMGTSPNFLAKKLGARLPPPIVIPRMSSPLHTVSAPQEEVAAAAEAFALNRSSSDARVDSVDGTGHRGSIASTRRSMLSFVSARSCRSVDDAGGDDVDARPPSVNENGGSAGEGVRNSISFSGSGTDSDLDEFFDAVAGADEGVWLCPPCRVHSSPHAQWVDNVYEGAVCTGHFVDKDPFTCDRRDRGWCSLFGLTWHLCTRWSRIEGEKTKALTRGDSIHMTRSVRLAGDVSTRSRCTYCEQTSGQHAATWF